MTISKILRHVYIESRIVNGKYVIKKNPYTTCKVYVKETFPPFLTFSNHFFLKIVNFVFTIKNLRYSQSWYVLGTD